MLDAFVIDEIKRRERDRGRDDRPAVELPLPVPQAPTDDGSQKGGEGESKDRGVVIIDYG
ncbi:MAG TPA: hypothetical protein VFR85_18215 [Anaeromyxobacteraceae bacterium]|nr:hypothetical protein [Anaeromyxobacteraceae bacterium]